MIVTTDSWSVKKKENISAQIIKFVNVLQRSHISPTDCSATNTKQSSCSWPSIQRSSNSQQMLFEQNEN